MNIPKPVMPKEHGLWVWVLLPFCMAAGSARGDADGFWFTFAGLFFWFMAVTPARMIYKGSKKDAMQNRPALIWCAVYALLGTLGAVGAVLWDHTMAWFFAVGAIAFYGSIRASHAGWQKGFFFEFGGIIFLSLGSFMGSYSVAGAYEPLHLAVWLFTFIFLMDRNTQTRLVVRAVLPYRHEAFPVENLKLIYRINIFISLLALLAVSATLAKFGLNKILVLPYLSGILVTLYFFKNPPASLRVVGYSELALAALFGVAFVVVSGNLY